MLLHYYSNINISYPLYLIILIYLFTPVTYPDGASAVERFRFSHSQDAIVPISAPLKHPPPNSGTSPLFYFTSILLKLLFKKNC